MMNFSIDMATNVLKSLIKVSPDIVKGAHDSQMVLINNRAYIVYECNDFRPGESDQWLDGYSEMSVVNMDNMEVATYTIAKSEQAFENVTLPIGCCFVPRILKLNDDTLRTYFISMNSNVRDTVSWYRDFSISKGSFSNHIFQVLLDTDDGTSSISASNFYRQAFQNGFSKPINLHGPYLLDVEKGFPGNQHLIVNNFSGQQNALCVWNSSLDTIKVIGNINEPQTEKLSEASAEILPDGRWGAIIRNDKSPFEYMFSASTNGKDWEEAHFDSSISNGSNSKPIFYHFNDYYFLGWQEKPCRTRFNIEVSKDCKYWKRLFSFQDEEFSIQYPSLSCHNNQIYICATHGFCGNGIEKRDSIWFGKLISIPELDEKWNSLTGRMMDLWPRE